MYQQLHELTLTNNPIPIFVHAFENFLNIFAILEIILQKLDHLLESNLPTVVDIKVGEGLFEMFLVYFCFEVNSGDQELCIVDLARAVGVNVLKDLFYFVLIYFYEISSE